MLFLIIIIFFFTSSFPDRGLHPSEQASRQSLPCASWKLASRNHWWGEGCLHRANNLGVVGISLIRVKNTGRGSGLAARHRLLPPPGPSQQCWGRGAGSGPGAILLGAGSGRDPAQKGTKGRPQLSVSHCRGMFVAPHRRSPGCRGHVVVLSRGTADGEGVESHGGRGRAPASRTPNDAGPYGRPPSRMEINGGLCVPGRI